MPEWLLPILIGVVIVGLAGKVWQAHEKRDQERFDAIWDQIGRNSESGMRKKVHDTANVAGQAMRIADDQDRRLSRLEEHEDDR